MTLYTDPLYPAFQVKWSVKKIHEHSTEHFTLWRKQELSEQES